ncbi:hypothetical protein THRCLA_02394 [Thraustotheca clavata]|uniref:Transmembrane protein n=1 Tax=Thraustotheca clavata TaxID=74557 RepID=A0A1W0A5B6_9STRA|nr:hypothetical protein THRCLA_02394 [Thraustotheca clavata]
MCGFGVALPFVQESFSFDDTCATQNALTINWMPFTSLFAYMMMNGNMSTACQLLSNNELSLCLQLITTLKSTSQDFISSPITIPSIDLRYLQFVTVGENGTIHVQSQQLLDDLLAFFGWMSIYEWVLQLREAVSFHELPTQVVTSSVAIYLCHALALLYIYHQPKKCTWFMFNRITSATWLNRSFILVRGVAAVLIMPLAIMLPFQSDEAVFFHSIPLSLFEALHPLTASAIARYARWTSIVVWLFLIVLDVWVPYIPTFSLHHSCCSENMDTMVYCTSRSIEIGSWKRALVLICILVMSVITSSIIIVVQSNKTINESIQSPLLPSAVVAFLDPECTLNSMKSRLDVIEAAMASLLSIQAFGNRLFFDSKLRLALLTPDKVTTEDGMILLLNALNPPVSMFVGPREPTSIALSKLKHRADKIILIGGVIYIVISLISNVAELSVARSTLSNAFGWAGFNSSGMHTFLATLINVQLLISNNQTIKVTDPSFVDITQLYNSISSNIAWSVNAPRRQLNDPSTPLRSIIINLRKMDPCKLPWMFTQY